MFKAIKKLATDSWRKLDRVLLICCLILTVMSILTLFFARENFGIRSTIMQVAMTIVGMIALLFIVQIDYRIFVDKYWKILLLASVALLGITLLIGSTGANGTESSNKSWLTIIKLGSFSLQIQPSEFTKIAFIISFSKHLSLVKDKINHPKTLAQLGVHAGIVTGLILLSGDLGVAIVYLGIIAIMLAFAGLSRWYFLGALGAIVVAFPFIWNLLAPYQQKRILVGFNPELDPIDKGWQPLLSRDGIIAGGLFGRGVNSGGFYEQNPTSHTDFIFSTYCEFFGFFAAILMIAVFIILVLRILSIAKSCGSECGKLICIGMAAMFTVQIVINIGMCLAVLPVIGITLPFISAGGSSMLALYMGVGIVHAIEAYEKQYAYGKSHIIKFTYKRKEKPKKVAKK